MTANANKPTLPAALRERIRAIHMQMLDIIEHMLTQLASQPQADATSLVAARRHFANTLQLWQFCARPTCRRGRCCRGEPKECLTCAMPLLPAETIASLLVNKKDRRRSAKRPQAASC